jgi:hypothetical protein
MHDETFLITRGTVRFIMGETELDARAGDYVVAPVGAKHTFANPFDEPAVMFNSLRRPITSNISATSRGWWLPKASRRKAFFASWRATRRSRRKGAVLCADDAGLGIAHGRAGAWAASKRDCSDETKA